MNGACSGKKFLELFSVVLKSCVAKSRPYSVGIWVFLMLVRTSTHKVIHWENQQSGKQKNRPDTRGRIEKHSGQGWHHPRHRAGPGKEVGGEGRTGKTRVVQNMFSSCSPWAPWSPSPDGTFVL